MNNQNIQSSQNSPKSVPSGGSLSKSGDDLNQIIEIRDPNLDVQDIMRKIRENMASRDTQLKSIGAWILSEDRLALRAAHESLRQRVQVYGHLGMPEPGLKGKISFFIKRVIRRVIKRHIDQEKDVQEAMLRFVERLIPYLDNAQYAAECLQRIEKIEATLKQRPLN
jgi:hypothetical protein